MLWFIEDCVFSLGFPRGGWYPDGVAPAGEAIAPQCLQIVAGGSLPGSGTEGSMIRKTIRQSKRPVQPKEGHRLQLTAVGERTRGGYVATCPQLQGCYTQGRTYEEVLRNIRDAIRLHLEDRLAVGEPLPAAGDVTLAVLEVAV